MLISPQFPPTRYDWPWAWQLSHDRQEEIKKDSHFLNMCRTDTVARFIDPISGNCMEGASALSADVFDRRMRLFGRILAHVMDCLKSISSDIAAKLPDKWSVGIFESRDSLPAILCKPHAATFASAGPDMSVCDFQMKTQPLVMSGELATDDSVVVFALNLAHPVIDKQYTFDNRTILLTSLLTSSVQAACELYDLSIGVVGNVMSTIEPLLTSFNAFEFYDVKKVEKSAQQLHDETIQLQTAKLIISGDLDASFFSGAPPPAKKRRTTRDTVVPDNCADSSQILLLNGLDSRISFSGVEHGKGKIVVGYEWPGPRRYNLIALGWELIEAVE